MKIKYLILLLLCFSNSSWAILVLYHIPKSAGISVEIIIGYQYSAANIYRIYTSQSISPYGEKWVEDPFYFSQHDLPVPGEIPLRNFRPQNETFIYGHIYFKDGFKHFPSATNVVFLRDPIKRLISHQKHWEICRDYYRSGNMNRSHVIPDGSPIEVANNLQVYYLSSFSSEDPSISLEKHLESAKQNLLDHFDFVGITEYFNDSIHALLTLFDFPCISDMPIVNRFSFKEITLSDHEIDELRKLNWADCELYSFAKELFEEKYKNISLKIKDRRKDKFVDRVNYTFDQAINGNGWGYREISKSAPYFCRTSFVKNPWITFNLKKKNYKINFLANSPIQKNLTCLKLIVNGHEIPLKRRNAGPWVSFKGFIPRDIIQVNTETKLALDIPELFKPSEHGQKLDDRSLGITVSKIQIQSI